MKYLPLYCIFVQTGCQKTLTVICGYSVSQINCLQCFSYCPLVWEFDYSKSSGFIHEYYYFIKGNVLTVSLFFFNNNFWFMARIFLSLNLWYQNFLSILCRYRNLNESKNVWNGLLSMLVGSNNSFLWIKIKIQPCNTKMWPC